jgi:hypothetical protein
MPKVASTPELLLFCEQADTQGWNRRANFVEIKRLIDPEGRHVVVQHAIVNDDPPLVRCFWMVKFKDDPDPHGLELDVYLARFNKLPDIELPESDDEEEETFA